MTNTSMTKRAEPKIVGRGIHAKRGVKATLRLLRDGTGRTQAHVAEASGMRQGDVSKLEAKSDLDALEVATLRRYVEALGGKLSLVVDINGARFTLAGASETK